MSKPTPPGLQHSCPPLVQEGGRGGGGCFCGVRETQQTLCSSKGELGLSLCLPSRLPELFSPLLCPALSLPLLQSPGSPLTRALCVGMQTRASTWHLAGQHWVHGAAALSKSPLPPRAKHRHLPEVGWGQPTGTNSCARGAAPPARALSRCNHPEGKGACALRTGSAVPPSREGCPHASSPAHAAELEQHRGDCLKISQVLPGLGCKELPAAEAEPQHSPLGASVTQLPECHCHQL